MRTFHEEHFSHQSLSHFEHEFLRHVHSIHSGDSNYSKNDKSVETDGWGSLNDDTLESMMDDNIAFPGCASIEDSPRTDAEKADSPYMHPETDTAAMTTGLQDGEVGEDGTVSECENTITKKRRKKRGGHNRKTEEKPDLRKRTWDVVEAGLDSLHYDDDEPAEVAPRADARRQQISYGEE